MSCDTHFLSHTCTHMSHTQVFDETSEEIRQRMEDLASQAAEVQAASKALDLREQQLSVSAKPTALCRLCRPVLLCSLVSRCPCLSVRVAQWVSASITLLLSRSVHVSKRCSERMLPHVSQSMCLLSHLPVYVSNVSQCAHARGQAAALASRVLPLHPLTAAPSFPCLPAACACRHMPRALVALDTLAAQRPGKRSASAGQGERGAAAGRHLAHHPRSCRRARGGDI
jgi:hypothetical protein